VASRSRHARDEAGLGSARAHRPGAGARTRPAPVAEAKQELPLTVGTAGHIDHGKTALVQALTGVDTDRLPEEKERGITIVLGFAPLVLPRGRPLSLVDVPGHERLVRVMVSGASGIDLYLLVVAADDGVMPQTLEHVRVLEALGVREGVVAVTKADLADPGRAMAQAHELLPQAEIVACSARTGQGISEVAAALERVAARVPSRALADASDDRAEPALVGGGRRASARRAEALATLAGAERAVLHVDRAFTIHGAGTVVTGTLWAGELARGQRVRLLPSGRSARVRGLQVHERPVERAAAGQRVAVNLAGIERRAVAPGDVVAGADAPVQLAYRLEAELLLHEPLGDRERVQVHHGTRSAPARAVELGTGRWQLRAERPLIAAVGDRLVLRRISPPGTLGGGVIVAIGRRRHAKAQPPAGGLADAGAGTAAAEAAQLDPGALALEQRLREAGAEPPSEGELGEQARHIPALRAAGRVVRIGRNMYAHVEAITAVRGIVERVIESEGSITLARLRDELRTSRKYAQALLEHFDAARVTRRLPDDRRVLRRGARPER
jgi:selenocysteine-specific elongation factor